MKIDQVIETEEGVVQFRGILQGKELAYVISTGLHMLFLQGTLAPTQVVEDVQDKGELH